MPLKSDNRLRHKSETPVSSIAKETTGKQQKSNKKNRHQSSNVFPDGFRVKDTVKRKIMGRLRASSHTDASKEGQVNGLDKDGKKSKTFLSKVCYGILFYILYSIFYPLIFKQNKPIQERPILVSTRRRFDVDTTDVNIVKTTILLEYLVMKE